RRVRTGWPSGGHAAAPERRQGSADPPGDRTSPYPREPSGHDLGPAPVGGRDDESGPSQVAREKWGPVHRRQADEATTRLYRGAIPDGGPYGRAGGRRHRQGRRTGQERDGGAGAPSA